MTTTLELVPQPVQAAPAPRSWVAPTAAVGAGILAAVAAVGWLVNAVTLTGPVGGPGF